MIIDNKLVEKLLSIIKQKYPSWESFQDKNFVDDEITYKKEASSFFHEQLSKDAFERLLDEQNYQEILERIKKVASKTNLLYLGHPNAGDANILFTGSLHKEYFCREFYNLIYGSEDIQVRFSRYLKYLDENSLPSKWTFPTYFLFLSNYNENFLVKPNITERFLNALGYDVKFPPKPDALFYKDLISNLKDFRNAFSIYGAKDLLDIQSLIYVCYAATSATPTKKDELSELFAEFIDAYLSTPQGEEHAAFYRSSRASALANYKEILQVQEQGGDITDLVIDRLIPHADNANSRAKGVWISPVADISGDIKTFFENGKLLKSTDWPETALVILNLIRSAETGEAKFKSACSAFSLNPKVKGFQTGRISPILSALMPDRYSIINAKPKLVFDYFTDSTLPIGIVNYPEANEKYREMISALPEDIFANEEILNDIDEFTIFDIFCHWLVGVKKYNFNVSYWKISPGESADIWDQCKNLGYISISWDEIGDVTEMDKKQFDNKVAEICEIKDDWSKQGAEQAWVFAKKLKIGDRVIANKGKSTIVGRGTVTGSYFFVDDTEYGHRVPVEWDDIEAFPIPTQNAWTKTMVKLDREIFEKLTKTSLNGEQPASSHYFSHKTFDLMSELSDKPTAEFVQENKNDLNAFLYEPARRLFNDIETKLPHLVCDVMETKKRIFSQLRKNDFGKGGAYDYYWGAFYPKESKRISDAQLFMWLRKDRIEFGFYIGEYGNAVRSRFVNNVRTEINDLKGIAENIHLAGSPRFGSRPEFTGNEAEKLSLIIPTEATSWLENIQEDDISIAGVLTRSEILSMSSTELVEQVTRSFESLFPLVLLAIYDDPMPEIAKYLQVDDDYDDSINPPYSKADLLAETGFDADELEKWLSAIERKNQAIIYGPPGTGKTYIAERIAKLLVSGSDGIIETVQFHPTYAYEDFIQGIRPDVAETNAVKFKLSPGRFLEFCNNARASKGTSVLIIDEINRAELSRVFGELMYLLEYRDKEIVLSGSSNRFKIPSNVRIIGTMNTADRSIALIDNALRRRFAFLALYPNYEILQKFHGDESMLINQLIKGLKAVNSAIDDRNYELGVSFFLHKGLNVNQLKDIWEMEIEPYLNAIFYGKDKAGKYNWEFIKKYLDE